MVEQTGLRVLYVQQRGSPIQMLHGETGEGPNKEGPHCIQGCDFVGEQRPSGLVAQLQKDDTWGIFIIYYPCYNRLVLKLL